MDSIFGANEMSGGSTELSIISNLQPQEKAKDCDIMII
jgi:hypothetical protein